MGSHIICAKGRLSVCEFHLHCDERSHEAKLFLVEEEELISFYLSNSTIYCKYNYISSTSKIHLKYMK